MMIAGVTSTAGTAKSYLPRNSTGVDARENQLEDHDRELSLPGSQPVTMTSTVGSRRLMFRKLCIEGPEGGVLTANTRERTGSQNNTGKRVGWV